jgi:hypothetical protein
MLTAVDPPQLLEARDHETAGQKFRRSSVFNSVRPRTDWNRKGGQEERSLSALPELPV